MKTTLEKVLLFRANANIFLNKQRNPEKPEEELVTKFTYAIRKMISRTNEIQKKYNDFVEDQQIDLALEDEKKVLVKNKEGGYDFTRENLKKLNSTLREKIKEEVEFEPYIATPPSDLGYNFIDIFTSFVIKEEDVK